jgi:hypothetical protein
MPVGSHGSLALLLGELPLPALGVGELLDEPGAKDPQRRDQRVELVQRVLAVRLRLEVELKPDAAIAARDLKRHLRFEVVRTLAAGSGRVLQRSNPLVDSGMLRCKT